MSNFEGNTNMNTTTDVDQLLGDRDWSILSRQLQRDSKIAAKHFEEYAEKQRKQRSVLPNTDIANMEWFQNNKLAVGMTGYMKNVVRITIPDCEKSIISELGLSLNFDVFDDTSASIPRVKQEPSKVTISAQNRRAVFKITDEMSEYHTLISNTDVYNSIQSATIHFGFEIVKKIIALGGKIVCVDYPSITFTDSCILHKLKSYIKKTYKYIRIKQTDEFVQFYQMEGYKFSYGKRLDTSIFVDVDGLRLDNEHLPSAIFDTDQVERHVSIKRGLKCRVEMVPYSSLDQHKRFYCHEVINTDDGPCFIFFDIDIKYDQNDDSEWPKERIQKELDAFTAEFNQKFKHLTNKNVDFAVCFNCNKEKFSCHLISTNIIMNNAQQFKRMIQSAKFKSLFGRNVDTQVYRKNGSLRTCFSHKDHDSTRAFPLMPFNYTSNDDQFQHLLLKPITKDCSLITYQTDYFKEYKPALAINNPKYNGLLSNDDNNYEIYREYVDKLIECHFNYQNCYSNYNHFSLFVNAIAFITSGSSGYAERLYNTISNDTRVRNQTKKGLIARVFDKCNKDKLNLHGLIRKLLSKYEIANVEQLTTVDADIKVVNKRYLTKEDVDIDGFLKSDKRKLFIKSSMGTGKTELLMNFLDNKDPKLTVLLVCTRRTMIAEYKKRLADLAIEYASFCMDDNYQMQLRLMRTRKISVCLTTCESIWRANEVFKTFDLIILDEIESISTQMCSKETHKTNLKFNNVILEHYCHGPKVIAMDGLLTDNMIKILTMNDDVKPDYVKNTYRPDKNIREITKLKLMIYTIQKACKKHKEIAIACDSRIVSISLYELLSGKKYDPQDIDDRFIVLNSDTSSFITITKTNLKDKITIYTPSMDVSVSITEFTPKYIFGMFVNSQISAYTKVQMLMRFRNTKDIIVFSKYTGKPPSDEEITNDILFNEDFDVHFNDDEFDSNEMFSHMNKLEDFTFDKIHIKEMQYSDLMKESFYHNFIYHETFKKYTYIKKLLKMETITTSDYTDDAYYKFRALYDQNKEYYYYIKYLEEIKKDIVKRHEMKESRDEGLLSNVIKNVMEGYSNYHFKARADRTETIKSIASNVFFKLGIDKKNYTNLGLFTSSFFENPLIKILYNIQRAPDRKPQLLLYYIFTTMRREYDGYYISMRELNEKCKMIQSSYFQNLTPKKLKLISAKYFTSNISIRQ